MKNVFWYLFVLFVFSSCSKNDFDSESMLDYSVGRFSSVSVFNTIPGSSSVAISEGAGNSAQWFVTANNAVSFGGYLPYRNWFSGVKTLTLESFSKTGKVAVQKELSLDAGKVYSLFMCQDKTIDAVISEDNVIKPKDGMAKIRVVHMGADAPAVSVSPAHFSNILFVDVKFKSVSDFREVMANEEMIWSISAAKGTNMPSIMSKFKLDNGGIYTLLIRGLVNSNDPDQEIGLKIIKH